MNSSWKSLIPSNYSPIISCHCVMKRCSARNANAEIVICTLQGQVLEFCNLKVINSCNIGCTDAENILFFTTYDSKCNKYYAIKCKSQKVVILSSGKKMQVVKEFSDVQKMFVNDFLETGSPQLGLWTSKGVQEPTPHIIWSGNAETISTGEANPFLTIINEKYQELSMTVDELKSTLMAKKALRIASNMEGQHYSADASVQLTDLIESDEKSNSIAEHPEKSKQFIQASGIWQKLHNGKWVIGISICNIGTEKVKEIHLILRSLEEEKIAYMTKIFISQSKIPVPKKHCASYRSKIYETWKESTEINPNEDGIVVGVLETPVFIGRSVATLSGTLTYSIQDDSQQNFHCSIPCIQLTVQDFVKRQHTPFTTSVTDADYLSVHATSFKIILKVAFMAKLQHPLQKMLVDNLKFTEHSSLSCLFHQGSDFVELAGTMLHIEESSPQEQTLVVFTRDKLQLYVFVHCMYTELPTSFMTVQLKETSELDNEVEDSAKSLLIEELELVIKALSKLVKERSKLLKIPKEKYNLLQEKLTEHEMRTDMAFSRLLNCIKHRVAHHLLQDATRITITMHSFVDHTELASVDACYRSNNPLI